MWNSGGKEKDKEKESQSETPRKNSEDSYNMSQKNSEKFIKSDTKYTESEPIPRNINPTSSEKIQSMTNLSKKPVLYANKVRSNKQMKNQTRSKSVNNETSKAKDKTKNEIQKDVDRTFQGEQFFKRDDTKEMLLTILFHYTEKSSLKYVQGMNFIAAYVLNHSLNFELSFNIFMFIQGK